MARSLPPYKKSRHMKGIMRSATPARSEDPPPNPRRLKYILPIKLSIKGTCQWWNDFVFADDKPIRAIKKKTHGKPAAIEPLKKSLPAKRLAAYLG